MSETVEIIPDKIIFQENLNLHLLIPNTQYWKDHDYYSQVSESIFYKQDYSNVMLELLHTVTAYNS